MKTKLCNFKHDEATNRFTCTVCGQSFPIVKLKYIPRARCGVVKQKSQKVHRTIKSVGSMVSNKKLLEEATIAAYELGAIGEGETLPKQLKRYYRELAEWVRLGRPTRTPEQIKACYEICRQCSEHKEPQDEPWIKRIWAKLNLVGNFVYCGICLCGVGKKKGSGIANMAVMANMKCKHPSGDKWASIDKDG